MRYRITLILILLGSISFAQSSAGYMGKQFAFTYQFMGALSFGPSPSYSHFKNHTQYFEDESKPFNSIYALGVEYFKTRKSSWVFEAKHYKDALYDGIYINNEFKQNAFDYYEHLPSVGLKSYTLSAGMKYYFGGGLAPNGHAIKFLVGASQIHLETDLEGMYLAYFNRADFSKSGLKDELLVDRSSVFGAAFALDYSWNRMILDDLILEVNFRYTFNTRMLGAGFNKGPNAIYGGDAMLSEQFCSSIFSNEIINFGIGLKYLIF